MNRVRLYLHTLCMKSLQLEELMSSMTTELAISHKRYLLLLYLQDIVVLCYRLLKSIAYLVALAEILF